MGIAVPEIETVAEVASLAMAIPAPAVNPRRANAGPAPSLTREIAPPADVILTAEPGSEFVTVTSVAFWTRVMPAPEVRPRTARAGPVPPLTKFTTPPDDAKLTEVAGLVLATVMAVAVAVSDTPVPAVSPFVAKVGPRPSLTKVSTPPADVSVTPPLPAEDIVIESAVETRVTPTPATSPFVSKSGPIPSATRDTPPAESSLTSAAEPFP